MKSTGKPNRVCEGTECVYMILCKVRKSLQSKLVTYFRISFEATAVARGSKEVDHAGRLAEK